jgi:hypothetical protein
MQNNGGVTMWIGSNQQGSRLTGGESLRYSIIENLPSSVLEQSLSSWFATLRD